MPHLLSTFIPVDKKKQNSKSLKILSSQRTTMAAAMVAGKRAASMVKLMEKLLLNPARSLEASTQFAVRSFNTNAQTRDVDDGDERSLDVDRMSERRVDRRWRMREDEHPFFSGVLDPFNPTRSLSEVLNMMDRMMDSPFPAFARGMTGGARRGWDAKETPDALHLRIDMPGLGKEHVKVSAEQNTLIIKGEGEEEEDAETGRRYSSRIDLPEGLYKIEGIRAEMKNGVLKVVVPKVKEEERKDVLQGFSDFVQEMLNLMANVRSEEKEYSLEELQGMLAEMAQSFDSVPSFSSQSFDLEGNDSNRSTKRFRFNEDPMDRRRSHVHLSGLQVYGSAASYG